MKSSFVILEAGIKEIRSVIDRLLKESNSRCVYLVDKDGKLIASNGETEHIDSASLASLTAGNIAATGALAKLMGEKEFTVLFHEGEEDNLHISTICDRVILVVLFDRRTSLGLVKLRAKRAGEDLKAIIQRLLQNSSDADRKEEIPGNLTDEDIENLF